ncbi:MAG: methylenetetrahydrofolate reductase [Clostridiales Family XIII bacterium]|nr:methylenetetrahydrofolate reductase [Clostridiales Family XIII bacterium]
MKITDLLKERNTFSFEVFPPKEDVPLDALEHTLSRLCACAPDFISITYGAGGTNKGRSADVCRLVKESGRTALPHFTCIGNTREMIDEYIESYLDLGIENVLLLRGDLPKGWTGTNGDFAHADSLIAHFRERHPELAFGAACYPETHIESDNQEEDVKYLRRKQDMGAGFFVTQLCHDATAYERFAERLEKAGVTAPVIVGVMPILSRAGTIKMTLSNGCSIPAELAAIIGKYEDDEEGFSEAGKEFTVRLIERYIAAGVRGLHLYTLNKHKEIAEIARHCDIDGFRAKR